MGIDHLLIICLQSEDGILTRAIFRDVTVWSDVTFASKNELARYVAKKYAKKYPLQFVWQHRSRTTT